MNERPTPETDAQEFNRYSQMVGRPGWVVGASLARRLERERDEITERWEKAANAYLIEQGKREAAERQRDELLAACEWAQSQLGKHTRPSPLDKAIASVKGGGK